MNYAKRLIRIAAISSLIITCFFQVGLASAQSASSAVDNSGAAPSHLRLVDRLDRPDDGYCIDVLGTPGYLRPDLPIFAHNCKPRLTSDSAVVFDAEGRILFTALNLCLTVAGVNSNALAGASVLVRDCEEATPFFDADRLQRFVRREDGRMALAGSELCLAVGTQSATTYSSSDRWRSLFVDDCNSVDPERSRWEFFVPVK